MKVRLGLVLATAALISGAGCASGGGGGAAMPAAGSNTPAGDVGIRPRDNTSTRSAELFLTQAQTAADEAEQTAKYRQALEAALQGIAADPQNPKSYFQAAQAYVGVNDFAGADSTFAKAEELHPPYALETEPYRERGWVNAYNAAIVPLNEGDPEAAAELFEMANRLYPERPEAFLQLGSIYTRMDQAAKGAEAFRTAMEMLEGSKETEMMDTAAAPIWEQHWAIATTGLGQALTLSEQYQEAADLYGQLLADEPENTQLIGSLASVLTEIGQPDSVQALYDNLLARPNLSERDLFNAGVGLYQIEQYDKAAEVFRAAADMNPFNRDARFNLVQTLEISEKAEALIPAAEELLEVDPLNGLGWLFLTKAHNDLGQIEEANEVFREYESIGYELEQVRLDGDADGGARITGQLKNTSGEPGTPVTLRFHFGGADGQEVGTLDIRVQLPEAGQLQVFSGDFSSPELVTGYRYEVVQ